MIYQMLCPKGFLINQKLRFHKKVGQPFFYYKDKKKIE